MRILIHWPRVTVHLDHRHRKQTNNCCLLLPTRPLSYPRKSGTSSCRRTGPPRRIGKEIDQETTSLTTSPKLAHWSQEQITEGGSWKRQMKRRKVVSVESFFSTLLDIVQSVGGHSVLYYYSISISCAHGQWSCSSSKNLKNGGSCTAASALKTIGV